MKNAFIPIGTALFLHLVFTVPLFSQIKTVFTYSGSNQSYVVPAGVTKIQIKAWGAGGGGGNYVHDDIGGGGGFVTGAVAVIPGQTLTIIVGGGGQNGAGSGAYGGGGSKSCGLGGRGGGRSAVIVGGKEVITAGAGGGGGGVAEANEVGGHGGGGLEGEPDAWVEQNGVAVFLGGGPGTQKAGGYAGSRKNLEFDCTCGGAPGSLHQGGDAGCDDNGFNGSGGGGFYGGGSGTDFGDGAGGGGSSFVPQGGSTTPAKSRVPGNIADPDYGNLAGYGGLKGLPGKPGRVVIISGLPELKVTDGVLIEGHSGTRNMLFLFILSKKFSSPVSVRYQTSGSTASASSDYIGKSGILTIPANTISNILSVSINGDALVEDLESFRLFLSSPVNTFLTNSVSLGYIVNDDGGATVSSLQVIETLDGESNGAMLRSGLLVKALQNPTRNQFTLLITSDAQEPISMRVVDVTGRVVKAIGKIEGNISVQFGAAWREGTYFAEISQGTNKKTIRLVKSN